MPPGASSTSVALAAEARYAPEPSTRVSVDAFSESSGQSPVPRKVTVNVAVSWPSPARCTITPEPSDSRPPSSASASASVAFHGRYALAVALLAVVSERSTPPLRHEPSALRHTPAVTLALQRKSSSGRLAWCAQLSHAVSSSSLQRTCVVLTSSTVALSAPNVASASPANDASICAPVALATLTSVPRLPKCIIWTVPARAPMQSPSVAVSHSTATKVTYCTIWVALAASCVSVRRCTA